MHSQTPLVAEGAASAVGGADEPTAALLGHVPDTAILDPYQQQTDQMKER